LNDASVT